MDFFSDRELGKAEPIYNEISVAVWNGIVTIIDSLLSSNALSQSFPEYCPDGYGISGYNINAFNDKVKALIPNIDTPITRKERYTQRSSAWDDFGGEVETKIDTYACLDLIEFIYHHLTDPIKVGELHSFFQHYHYSFNNSMESKKKFRTEINSLFERNRIAYTLDLSGSIKRLMPEEFKKPLAKTYRTHDSILNELLQQATHYFYLPKPIDRLRGVEKLWDAFERAKTYYGDNKKLSANQLIHLVANGNSSLELYIASEAATLTKIGNEFHIRHFEKDKHPITDSNHIDFLFFRMLALIDMFIKELEK